MNPRGETCWSLELELKKQQLSFMFLLLWIPALFYTWLLHITSSSGPSLTYSRAAEETNITARLGRSIWGSPHETLPHFSDHYFSFEEWGRYICHIYEVIMKRRRGGSLLCHLRTKTPRRLWTLQITSSLTGAKEAHMRWVWELLGHIWELMRI